MLRRNHAFRLIWAGQTASIFGDRVTGIALPWLLLAQTHSPFEAALVTAAQYVPLVAFGLVAGVVTDRFSRRALMIACDVGRACALALVVLVGRVEGFPPLWLLVGVVLVLGAGRLFFQVAYGAWLPDVASDALLSRATAALEASDAASTLTGPTLGGALISLIGPVLALGADAVSYGASACALALTRQVARAGSLASAGVTHGTARRGWSDALDGLRFLFTSPERRLLAEVGMALAASAGSIELLLATLAQVQLRLPAWQAGLIFGAAGVGGLLGSAVAPRLYVWGYARGLLVAFAVAACAAVVLAFAGGLAAEVGFPVALGANLVLDGAVSLAFILSGTRSALITPRELRGRVGAAAQMSSALVRGLALLAAGAIAAQATTLPAFLFLAACFICAGLLLTTQGVHQR